MRRVVIAVLLVAMSFGVTACVVEEPGPGLDTRAGAIGIHTAAANGGMIAAS